jgi:alcohol dehydrogenase
MGSVPRFAKVATLLGEKVDHLSTLDQARHAATAVKSLYQDLKIPQSLDALGIPKDAIPDMAKAAVQVTRLMDNNPRQMTAEDAEGIYAKAFQ